MDAPLYDGCCRLSFLSVRQIAPNPLEAGPEQKPAPERVPDPGSAPRDLRAGAITPSGYRVP